MKKLRILLPALLAAALLLSCLVFPASAETEKYSEKELGVSLNINGSDSAFLTFSILNQGYVTLTNRTGKNLEGSLTLSFKLAYRDAGSSFILPFSLADGTEKRVPFTFDISDYYTVCSLELRDSSDRLLRVIDAIPVTSFFGPNTVIGWMTDDAGSAGGLFNQYYTGTPFVRLTPDCFPEDITVLRDYAAIIVTNVDFSASSPFSQKQLSVLRRYLAMGGNVILGDGPDTSALAFFDDYFSGPVSPGSSDSSVSVQTKDLSVNYFGSSSKNLESGGESTLKLPNQKVLVVNDPAFCPMTDPDFDSIVFYGDAERRHSLYISSVNLADKQIVSLYDSASLLETVLSSNLWSFASLNQDKGRPYQYHSLLESLGAYIPNIGLIMLILAVYAGVGIVLPFLIGRRKKKSSYVYLGIPAGAVLFSLVLFGYSFFAHGAGSSAWVASVTELEKDGNAEVYSIVKAVTPASGSKTVSLGRDNTVYLLFAEEYENNGGRSYTETVAADYRGAGGITVGSVQAWASTYAQCFTPEKYPGAFDIRAEFAEGSSDITVTVTNNTGKDLCDAVVYAFGTTWVVGSFPAGETRTQTCIGRISSKPDFTEICDRLYYGPLGISNRLSADMRNFSFDRARYYRNDLQLENLFNASPEAHSRAILIGNRLDKLAYSNMTQNSVSVIAIDPSADETVYINGRRIRTKQTVSALFQTETFALSEETGISAVGTMDPLSDYIYSQDADGYTEVFPGSMAAYAGPANQFYVRKATSLTVTAECRSSGKDLPNVYIGYFKRDSQNTTDGVMPLVHLNCSVEDDYLTATLDMNSGLKTLINSAEPGSAKITNSGYIRGYDRYASVTGYCDDDTAPFKSYLFDTYSMTTDGLVLVIASPDYSNTFYQIRDIRFCLE